ncbi:hypothetical protein C6501_06020 [Candidatus Poribacteria bacterium]|nr:MAG: hypothetical protein C6501_06020 [Candidatus Poribacteria bacterium]
MTQEKFQEHILKELGEIKNLFIKNEEDHGKLDSKIESVRGELAEKIESVRTEMESIKAEINDKFNSQLKWIIGSMLGFGIKIAALVFLIIKYLTPP